MAGADRHDPFPADRLHRVEDQIHEHLLEHVPVRQEGRQLVAEFPVKAHPGPFKRVAGERQDPLDDCIDLGRGELGIVLLGEIE